jgi:soluble lytic murein transglycosylase-like protein
LKLAGKFALALMALALVGTAWAADVAVLKNGFSIRCERREVRGEVTRLYLDAGPQSGYIDVPTSQIASIAPDDSVATAANPIAPEPPSLADSVKAASRNTGVDPDLIESVIHSESSFNPHAVSRKGAQGLMQLMPQTSAQLGVKDAFDPAANIDGGSRYLRDLLLKYDRDMATALAAYNAGPQRVEQYHGVPPYRETHAYVARVIEEFNRKKLAEQALASPSSRKRVRPGRSLPRSNPSADGKLTSSQPAGPPR